jgi:hypothetical protein
MLARESRGRRSRDARKLAANDIAENAALADLPRTAIEIARAILPHSKLLAMMYLHERVPGTAVSLMSYFMEEIVEPDLDPATWTRV